MTRRFGLYVAVVGALLAGGATTGTTHAAWTSEAIHQGTSVSSGSMGFDPSASPASLTVTRGTTATVRITVTDTSTASAKNLVQRITPVLGGGLPSGVTSSLSTLQSGACSGGAQDAVSLTPGQAFTTCLHVTASASTTATSATATVTFSGAQLQGGTPRGWTAPTRTVSVPVTITAPLAAPTIRCAGATQSTLTWPAVSGATGYVVTSSPTQTGSYGDVATQASTSYTATLSGQSTTYWRVRATNTSSTSAPSNTLRITRTGNSYSCLAVTP